jgi:hypothetical protein
MVHYPVKYKYTLLNLHPYYTNNYIEFLSKKDMDKREKLRSECRALKHELSITVNKSTANPFPIDIAFTVEQPEYAHAFDVFELKPILQVHSYNPVKISVKIDPEINGIPLLLAVEIEKTVFCYISVAHRPMEVITGSTQRRCVYMEIHRNETMDFR